MKRQSGFTLVELVIAMAFFSIILVAILMTITLSISTQVKSASQFNVNNFANSIINFVKANPDAQNGTYDFYFNDGDDLEQKMKNLTPGIETNMSDLRFEAIIQISANADNIKYDNLSMIKVTIKDLKKNGDDCYKEYYVDR